MKKHLIYTTYKLVPSAGGPAGYLANLKSALEQREVANVDFFCSISSASAQKSAFTRLIKLLLPKKLLMRLTTKLKLKNFENIVNLMILPDNFSEYSAIHFHSTLELYYFSAKFSEKLNDKLIYLMSHSPQMPYQEHLASLALVNNNENKLAQLRAKFKAIDYQAFSLADRVIFPSANAMEPYLQDQEFSSLIKSKPLDFIYTGCAKLAITESSEHYRQALGFSLDDVVVTFIGRHNSIKGYDLLQQAALTVWETKPQIKFVIAGDESPLNGLNHPNWLELGRISNPGDLLNAANIFILPNRQTYFDLILLEVLSVGIPAIVSNSGGNKDIIGLSCGTQAFICDDHADLARAIIDLSVISHEEIARLRCANTTAYANNFTLLKFADSYIELIKHLDA